MLSRRWTCDHIHPDCVTSTTALLLLETPAVRAQQHEGSVIPCVGAWEAGLVAAGTDTALSAVRMLAATPVYSSPAAQKSICVCHWLLNVLSKTE